MYCTERIYRVTKPGDTFKNGENVVLRESERRGCVAAKLVRDF